MCRTRRGSTCREGRGLGVLVAELTGDNRPDIYVANDASACWLFANRGNLTFEEIGEEVGVARDGNGEVLSGMGVAQGDIDGDGLLDLVVTNFYRSIDGRLPRQGTPRGVYRDASSWLGLKAATRRVLGFGLLLVDFDGDGRVDLFQTNGHVLDRERLEIPFAMAPTLLRNTGIPLQDVGRDRRTLVQASGPRSRARRRRPRRRRPSRCRRLPRSTRRPPSCETPRTAAIIWVWS